MVEDDINTSRRATRAANISSNDFAIIISPEITPFKGLDIKPLISTFYAQGTTNGAARQARGGLNTTSNWTTSSGDARGGINEYRHTVGLDARLRMGPFSLDPTVLYQFGSRGVQAPTNAAFVSSGVPVNGKKYYSDIDAWLIDVRGGFQLGPLLLEGLAMYTTGNTARNNTLGTVRYFQPLDTDTGYLADWGTAHTSLGIDFSVAHNGGATRLAYPGVSIGFDKYGRMQFGAKATYAVTPELSISGGASGIWTAEAVDRNGSVSTAGTGITPVFAGNTPRDNKSYVGTELHTTISWRFAPGLVWDNQIAYLIMGPALDAVTDPSYTGRNTNDPFLVTSRIRFTF
jgi:hypothetical protein